MLTLRICINRLALLKLAQVCGDCRGYASNVQSNEGCRFASSVTGNRMRCRGLQGPIIVLICHLRAYADVPGDLVELFQNLRDKLHDSKHKNPGGKHKSGHKTPESPTWFRLPRQTENKKLNRRERVLIRRNRHGIARATEGLRRLRLPMVPGSDTGDRILQGL